MKLAVVVWRAFFDVMNFLHLLFEFVCLEMRVTDMGSFFVVSNSFGVLTDLFWVHFGRREVLVTHWWYFYVLLVTFLKSFGTNTHSQSRVNQLILASHEH